MLVVDILSWKSKESSKTKIICRLGWDEQLKKIVILKGKRIGKQILKDKYLDKRYYPKKLKYISAKQGKYFIKNLCYGLAGTRVWATIPYKENTL
jgi:hypothetical protein